ncbi:MAG: methyltransferase domain-containing protein [bacterium]
MSDKKSSVDTNYLRVAAKLLKGVKKRSYELMAIKPGHRVLDVGCGPGFDTARLANLVGEKGSAVGIDHDEAMIAEADRYANESGVANRVTHKQADVYALPFGENEFDSCRSERLFQHLLKPEQALDEMIRVTKNGGWVVVLDTDWGAISMDTPEVDIERRLARFRAEHMLNNGYAGRQLYRLFRLAKLGEIKVEGITTISTDYEVGRYLAMVDKTEKEALAAGVITADELRRLRASSERARDEGLTFGSGCMILAAGRKKSG